MNPADDTPRWYSNSDRRNPPQADIVELMARLDERLKSRERHDVEVIAKLNEVQTEQTAAREERHIMRDEQQEMREEQKTMREEIKPLTQALNAGRAIKWFAMAVIFFVIALANGFAWIKEHIWGAMRLGVVLLVVFIGAAFAHQAPRGWQYDAACCSERDCVPISAHFVRVGPDGFTVTIPAGAHPFVKDEPLTFNMPHRSDRVRPSGDDAYHVCVNPWRTPLCLYVPPGGV